MNRKCPIFPKKFIEKENFNEIDDYDIVEDTYFHDISSGKPLDHVEFRSCVFKNVDFSELNVSRLNFVHVKLEHCDLSNLDFHETTCHSVEFIDCKLLGTQFFAASMKNVLIDSCLGNMANFSGTRLENIEIKNCVFEESYWSDIITLKNLEVEDCKFTDSEFIHTTLSGIDFTSCEIQGIKIDAESLKGIIVNEFQAIILSTMLGIVIK